MRLNGLDTAWVLTPLTPPYGGSAGGAQVQALFTCSEHKGSLKTSEVATTCLQGAQAERQGGNRL